MPANNQTRKIPCVTWITKF